ncbi:MAG TPA: hypothetical protein VMZ03_01705 [Chitinophagaceae bacterium]|nr:hypothetical protein [Chitinophagaceae bacterium]
MKRLLLSLSCILTVIAATAAVDPDPVSEEVKTSFKKEFPGAQVLSWSDLGELVKATFLYSGYRSEAYFSAEGELQGSVRNIFYNQVPLAVSKEVDRKFTDADVMEVSEITNANGTSYIIRLESEKKKYKVQVDASGNTIKSEKIKK